MLGVKGTWMDNICSLCLRSKNVVVKNIIPLGNTYHRSVCKVQKLCSQSHFHVGLNSVFLALYLTFRRLTSYHYWDTLISEMWNFITHLIELLKLCFLYCGSYHFTFSTRRIGFPSSVICPTLWTPPGCPTIQLWHYLESTHSSQVKVFSSIRLSLSTPNFRHQL